MEEHTVIIIALAGIAALFLTRHHDSSMASGALAGGDTQTLPWYLSYNAQSPRTGDYMAALPNLATGIENTTQAPCSTCSSQLGITYGSQY